MINSNIYSHDRASKPTNIQEIKNYLSEYHDSLFSFQFNDTEFKKFTNLNNKTFDEIRVIIDILIIIKNK
jgi:hypothetical protein